MTAAVRSALAVATAGASIAAAVAVEAFAGTPNAEAATAAAGFYVNGGGFGHGVGMSQYGAFGFALHGYGYRQILSHYYRDTTLAKVSSTRIVTVLLKNGTAAFRGASKVTSGAAAETIASGQRPTASGAGRTGGKTAKQPVVLKPQITYNVVMSGGQLKLMAGRHKIATLSPPVVVSGSGPLTLAGTGSYRGSLEFRPGPKGGVQTVNVVELEDYVRGVVADEMPSHWPAQALEAQAVAARTYAIAVSAAGSAFDVYSDTRSQMYGGVAAETPSTDAAEAATRGQVVDYAGQPATTYFFSSSGGYTESVQNVWLGVTPEAWLVGVPDPYDDVGGNPYYRWHEAMSIGSAARTLGRLVKGSLQGIKVLEHGVSPRIVRAAVVGTKGTTTVTGTQLRQVFGLRSTYAWFTTITIRSVNSTPAVAPTRKRPTQSAPKVAAPISGGVPKAGVPKAGSASKATTVTVTTPIVPPPSTVTTPAGTAPTPTGASGDPAPTRTTTTGGGGVAAVDRVARSARARRPRVHHALQGTAFPAVAGETIAAQRLVSGGWRTVGSGRVTPAGSYDISVGVTGVYRVVYRGVDGPAVSVN